MLQGLCGTFIIGCFIITSFFILEKCSRTRNAGENIDVFLFVMHMFFYLPENS